MKIEQLKQERAEFFRKRLQSCSEISMSDENCNQLYQDVACHFACTLRLVSSSDEFYDLSVRYLASKVSSKGGIDHDMMHTIIGMVVALTLAPPIDTKDPTLKQLVFDGCDLLEKFYERLPDYDPHKQAGE